MWTEFTTRGHESTCIVQSSFVFYPETNTMGWNLFWCTVLEVLTCSPGTIALGLRQGWISWHLKDCVAESDIKRARNKPSSSQVQFHCLAHFSEALLLSSTTTNDAIPLWLQKWPKPLGESEPSWCNCSIKFIKEQPKLKHRCLWKGHFISKS